MRTFLTVSHTVPPNGDWGLEDLSGAAGRVDLLCRNAQAALHYSHDLRRDTRVAFVFLADPSSPRTVVLDPRFIRHLNPDERSTASRIRKALRHPCPDAWFEDVEPGIQVAPFGLAEAIAELGGTPVALDKDGAPLETAAKDLPADPLFLMGDHIPLSEDELAAAPDAVRISLGPVWLHGNHAITITHYLLDRAAASGA